MICEEQPWPDSGGPSKAFIPTHGDLYFLLGFRPKLMPTAHLPKLRLRAGVRGRFQAQSSTQKTTGGALVRGHAAARPDLPGLRPLVQGWAGEGQERRPVPGPSRVLPTSKLANDLARRAPSRSRASVPPPPHCRGAAYALSLGFRALGINTFTRIFEVSSAVKVLSSPLASSLPGNSGSKTLKPKSLHPKPLTLNPKP